MRLLWKMYGSSLAAALCSAMTLTAIALRISSRRLPMLVAKWEMAGRGFALVTWAVLYDVSI